MFKKLTSAILATITAATIFAGCSTAPASSTASTASTESAKQETLKLALWDYETVGYDKAIVEAFQKDNTNIKVDVITCPNADYATKISTMLAGGDDLDVFYGKSNTDYPTYVLKNYALKLDDLIAKNNFDTKPYGTVLEQHYKINGGIYAIPYRTNDWVIYYNKDIFDKAKVAYPTNDMTWEQFGELGKKVTSGEGTDKTYGIGLYPKMGFITPILIGKDPSFDVMTSDFSSLKYSVDTVMKWQNTDLSYEPYATGKAMNQDQTYFFKGKTAMFYDGSWFTQMLVSNSSKVNFKWGIVKSPYWQGNDKKGFATSTPICINSKTTKVDAAWKLLSYISGEKGANILAQNMMVPAYMSANTMKTYKEATKIDDESYKALTDNKTYSFGQPNTIMTNISNAINEEIELVITGNQSVDDAVNNLTKRRTEIIAQNK